MNSLILCWTKRNIIIGCYSMVILLACLGCKPTKDSFSASELQQEFKLQFGFPPGEDVADIKCKIVTVGDTVTQWMIFRADPETIRKIATPNFRKVKSDERTKCIPIVIMTSSKEESDIIAGYKLGANSFIVKPMDFDKFMVTVRDLGMYWLLLNEPPK